MYNVLDVSRYIINYSNEKDYGVTNLKLQKLLYFVQAAFVSISKNSKACFLDTIEAWTFGPVVPVAYHEFKRFGSADIPTVNMYLTYDSNTPWDAKKNKFDDKIINKEDKNRINNVIDFFSDYSAADLVEITHNQAPWKDAYEPGKNNVISIESIREYFIG